MYKQYGDVIENANLQNYNTYKIKTSCDYLVFPNNIENLKELIKYLNNNNIKYFIIGNGSNVILSDNHFHGVIISLKNLNDIKIDNDIVIANAGVMMPKLVMETVNNGLKGLEWALGIPGTLGGSIYGNAGAYLSEIMDFFVSCDCIDKNGIIKTLTKDDIKYDYRYTSFKDNNDLVIISATLKLNYGDKDESLRLMEDRKQRRLNSQPLEYPSAGSVFRNPSKELPAGKLIEEANLKGYRVGGAEISEKHANFIINVGNATSNDVKKLIKLIKERIKENNNIDLKCEQQIIDWD